MLAMKIDGSKVILLVFWWQYQNRGRILLRRCIYIDVNCLIHITSSRYLNIKYESKTIKGSSTFESTTTQQTVVSWKPAALIYSTFSKKKKPLSIICWVFF